MTGLPVSSGAESAGSDRVQESGVLDPDAIRRAFEHMRRGPYLTADSLPPVHPDLWSGETP